MMRPSLFIVAVGLAVTGCNTTTINTPIRSFDRPSDVAMICVQYDQDAKLLNPRDLSDCMPVNRNNLRIQAKSSDGTYITGSYIYPRLRALVSQTARGELAEVDVDAALILDPNPQVPGFNFFPVGKLPEHVRASEDGCRAVTTNAGSCDLAVVDLAVVYNQPLLPALDAGVLPGTDAGAGPDYADNVVRRVRPSVNGVVLGARPSWVEMPPQLQKATRGFDPGGFSGQCRGGQYTAWVALPACQLVVEVSLDAPDTGKAEVLRALRVGRDSVTTVTDLTTLSCEAECENQAAPAGADLGVSPDGGYSRLPTDQALPSALALDFEAGLPTGRLFITDPTNPKLFVVPVDRATATLGVPRSLTLSDRAYGVSLGRVSPRTQAGKFLYAIARDNTVRVVDLDREVECETQPDPRASVNGQRLLDPIPATNVDPRADVARLGCLPVGSIARSPLFTSPGIALPNGALAKDVAFVHVDVLQPTDNTLQPLSAGPQLLVGDFAWVVSSDGRATVINIFDACPAPNVPLGLTAPYTPSCALGNVAQSRADLDLLPGRPKPFFQERMAHRIRQAQIRYTAPVSCTDPSGATRLQDENNPYSITIGTGVGTGTVIVDGGMGVYPTLVSVPLAAPPAAASCPVLQQSVGYQDLDQIHSDTWTVAWEPAIPFTARTARLTVNGRLTDAGGAFCTRGALGGDKVYLLGCTSDIDCDYAQTCYRDPGAPSTVGTGLCLDRDQKRLDEEVRNCAPLLRGIRRYRALSIRQAPAPGLTEDVIRLGEIYQPEHPAETKTCDPSDARSCDTVPVEGIVNGLPANLPTSCLLDLDGQHRCLRACTPNDPTEAGACGTGFQCAPSHDVNNVVGPGRCMRMPLDDIYVKPREQGGYGCLRELQPYEIHTGEQFLVTGIASGQLANYQPGPDGECQLAPNATSSYVRLRQPRIPLIGVPDCFAAGATPTPDQILSTIVPPSAPSSNICLFAAGQVHFENPYLAFGLNLPPGAPPEKYALSFIVVGGGFSLSRTLGVDVVALQPTAAVTGPDLQSVFVVDEGKQSTGSGLRGQLLRLSTIGVATDPGFIVR